MVDWKRVKDDLDPEANIHFGKFGLGPCEHLVDSKWSHYGAQQNLNAAILKDSYGIDLESMSLFLLHESRSSFVVVPIPKMLDMARCMLQSKNLIG